MSLDWKSQYGRASAHDVFPRGLRFHEHLMLHAHLASISCMAAYWNSQDLSQLTLAERLFAGCLASCFIAYLVTVALHYCSVVFWVCGCDSVCVVLAMTAVVAMVLLIVLALLLCAWDAHEGHGKRKEKERRVTLERERESERQLMTDVINILSI